MSVTKSEIKMLTAQEIGRKFEEHLKSVDVEVHRCFGAHAAMYQVAKAIESQILSIVKTDLESGKLSTRMEAKEIADYTIRNVSRSIELCRHYGDIAKNEEIKHSGAKLALEKNLDYLGKFYAQEQERIDAIKNYKSEEEGINESEVDANNIVPIRRKQARPTGVKPDSTIKSKRTPQKKKQKIEEGKVTEIVMDSGAEPNG